LLLSYMMCQPGKKLLFMGGEIAQWNEWNCNSEIEWFLLLHATHSGVQRMVKELNRLYLDNSCLWEHDFDHTGFEWVNLSDVQNSVISYLRKGSHERFLCVHNFTPTYYPHYFLHLQGVSRVEEVFNSDAERYGGSGKVNAAPRLERNQDGSSIGLSFQLSPLATMIFRLS
jgi:1,4-alpha-glucan branching enzyme